MTPGSWMGNDASYDGLNPDKRKEDCKMACGKCGMKTKKKAAKKTKKKK